MALVPEHSRGTAVKQLDPPPPPRVPTPGLSDAQGKVAVGPHVEKEPQGAVGAPVAFQGGPPPPTTPLGPLSLAKSQHMAVTPAPDQN